MNIAENIPDPRLPRNAALADTHGGRLPAPAQLDGDMAFFEFFTTLQTAALEGLAAPVGVSSADPPPRKPQAPPSEKPDPRPATAAAASPAGASGTEPQPPLSAERLEPAADLVLLESDLSAEDARALRQFVALHGVPATGGLVAQTLGPAVEEGVAGYKTLGISAGLGETLEKAWKTGRPVRIALDDRSSVVLKFAQGKVSAEFMTSDQALSLALRQQLAELRQRMEARHLPVGTLEHRFRDEERGRHKPPREQAQHE